MSDLEAKPILPSEDAMLKATVACATSGIMASEADRALLVRRIAYAIDEANESQAAKIADLERRLGTARNAALEEAIAAVKKSADPSSLVLTGPMGILRRAVNAIRSLQQEEATIDTTTMTDEPLVPGAKL